ncbi:MAG: molybdopterin molybdotransferase MoeA [Planctomycetota bacterium]
MAGKRVDALLPAMVDPHAAVAAMLSRVLPVRIERVLLGGACGRVLAEDVVAERDSPAADVSAMDGYAVRADSVRGMIERGGDAALPVAFEVVTGDMPGVLPEAAAARVFTGGVVPTGADAVVPRELVSEAEHGVTLGPEALPALGLGRHVRPRGENAKAGQTLLGSGVRVTPAAVATLAANGLSKVGVFAKVRVGIAVSGNEVRGVGDVRVESGAVRDANGPTLRALVADSGWCTVVEVVALPDDLSVTTRALGALAARCDLVLTTGGVSMGDHDVVPDAVLALGGAGVYHHLSMRPGKPNFGAVLPGGVPVIALPGNPVSALVGAVVLAGPVLRRCAGYGREPVPRWLEVDAGPVPNRPATFRQYVPATVTDAGGLRPLPHRGSGDVAAIGIAAGVFEVPPGQAAFDETRRRWHPWTLSP